MRWSGRCHAGRRARVAFVSFDERAMVFDCHGERLVGVVAAPRASARVGVVIVVGGPQYRAGSHRQFVLLSRALADAGIAVLRFDHRGMGDSTGAARAFEDSGADIAAAIGALQAACPTVARVALWGLCDAAAGALIYYDATRDPRVDAIALLNPWVHTEAMRARAELKHYYLRKLGERAFWSKLLRGRVELKDALRSLRNRVRAARRGGARAPSATAFQDRMAHGLRAFAGPVLLVLSEHDLTAREFVKYTAAHAEWKALLARRNVERHELAGADHTFSSEPWRTEIERRTLVWLQSLETDAA